MAEWRARPASSGLLRLRRGHLFDVHATDRREHHHGPTAVAIGRDAQVQLERDRRRPVVMLSTVGGMDIEEVAASQPEKIARGWPSPLLGLLPFEARSLAFTAGVPETQREAVADIARRLYAVYVETDASLVEINPLFVQKDGSVLAGDAKLDIDDNALFRQPNLAKLKEISP